MSNAPWGNPRWFGWKWRRCCFCLRSNPSPNQGWSRECCCCCCCWCRSSRNHPHYYNMSDLRDRLRDYGNVLLSWATCPDHSWWYASSYELYFFCSVIRNQLYNARKIAKLETSHQLWSCAKPPQPNAICWPKMSLLQQRTADKTPLGVHPSIHPSTKPTFTTCFCWLWGSGLADDASKDWRGICGGFSQSLVTRGVEQCTIVIHPNKSSHAEKSQEVELRQRKQNSQTGSIS